MDRDQRKHSSSDARTPAPEVPSRPASDAGSAPSGTSEPRGSGGVAIAGAWEAGPSLMEAMGVSSGPTIYRDALDGAPAAPTNASAVDQALSMSGQGESHASGATFHTGSYAAEAASSLGAAAFTAGADVYFGAGHYSPGTATGDTLIQHELTHVEQGRGVAAPTPGNYSVSDPGDAAEVAARSAASGGAGDHGSMAAGTIHRDLVGSIMGAVGADKLEEFLTALAANDAAGAQTKWGSVNFVMKQTIRFSSAIMNVVGHYPGGLKADPILSVIDVMGKDALPIMKEVGVAFDKVAYVDAILDGSGHDAAYWMPELKTQAVFDPWLARMPSRAALTEARLTKLTPYMNLASDQEDAKKIWKQAYPDLQETATDVDWTAKKLNSTDVKAFWVSIQGKVPLSHAQTISGGFFLGDQEMWSSDAAQAGRNLTPAAGPQWIPVGFGWHNSGYNHIIMPPGSIGAGGGGTGHDMTGGDNSGVAVGGGAGDPALTHWDGTMLHEIGHGVSSKTGGEDYAKTQGDWKGQQGWDAWSKNLFDDTTAATALPTPAPTPTMSAADARRFLAEDINPAGGFIPTGFTVDTARVFCTTHFGAQPLTQYHDTTKSGTAEYMAGAPNFVGSRTYVWLDRGGLGFTDYKQDITTHKVSWYSISSLLEWFAEQYTNYYRTAKAAPPGPDGAAIKAHFDELDARANGPDGALPATPGAPTPGGGGGSATAPGGAGGAPAGPAPNPDIANRHRMNF